ncbi:MAG: hydrogenase maturation nickel metallochaperone HypA [Terriglobia bacterium]
MHELSIAISIVELAEEESERRGGATVSAIHLKLGRLSGVVKEALLSSYDLASENTSLAGSRLVIEEIPIVVYCSNCEARRELSSMQQFSCPECHMLTPDVLQGRELEVVALELQE